MVYHVFRQPRACLGLRWNIARTWWLPSWQVVSRSAALLSRCPLAQPCPLALLGPPVATVVATGGLLGAAGLPGASVVAVDALLRLRLSLVSGCSLKLLVRLRLGLLGAVWRFVSAGCFGPCQCASCLF